MAEKMIMEGAQPQLAASQVLIIFNIPAYTPPESIKKFCDGLPTIQDLRVTRQKSTKYDLVIIFRTEEEALQTYSSDVLRTFTVNHQKYEALRVQETDSIFTPLEEQTKSLVDHTNNKQGVTLIIKEFPKPVCLWCRCDLEPDSNFSTPCLDISCEFVICYDCLKRALDAALKDRASMPLECCNKPFHPDVLRGIVLETDLEKYRERYEEMCTEAPFYCPVSRCSAFIPPRKIPSMSEKLDCPACGISICTKCRRTATEAHICPSNPDVEEENILQKFGYKSCPKCGAGNAKMFGCNYMRCCLCGAHYCWKCKNMINLCSCRGGDESDHRNTTEDRPEEPVDNLDDPEREVWEATNLDFGDEPNGDEYTWTCDHDFQPFNKENIRRYWMAAREDFFGQYADEQDWERDIVCMICWEEVKVTTSMRRENILKHETTQDGAENDVLRAEEQKMAHYCCRCGIIACQRCKLEHITETAPKVTDQIPVQDL